MMEAAISLPRTRLGTLDFVFWKLTLAGIQHGRISAAMNIIVIATSLTPVLITLGLGQYRNAAAPSSASTVKRIALPRGLESQTLRPSFQPFVAALLTASVAITFLSMWKNARRRNQEIAVLRILGASQSFLIALVLTEAAVIGFGGAIHAIVISQSVMIWLNVRSAAAPAYSIGIKWCLETFCMIMGAAITGSTIPCTVSIHQDLLELLERD